MAKEIFENKVINPIGGGNSSVKDEGLSIKDSSKKTDRYDSFDGLRAIAAFGIAIMHYLVNIDKGVAETLKEVSFMEHLFRP